MTVEVASRILQVPQVAFDESGNTGGDLLSAHQPYYALASIGGSPDVVGGLAEALPDHSGEPKYGRLRKSMKGRALIVDIVREAASQGLGKIFVVHKRFMVVAKIVDILVETLAHRTARSHSARLLCGSGGGPAGPGPSAAHSQPSSLASFQASRAAPNAPRSNPSPCHSAVYSRYSERSSSHLAELEEQAEEERTMSKTASGRVLRAIVVLGHQAIPILTPSPRHRPGRPPGIRIAGFNGPNAGGMADVPRSGRPGDRLRGRHCDMEPREAG